LPKAIFREQDGRLPLWVDLQLGGFAHERAEAADRAIPRQRCKHGSAGIVPGGGSPVARRLGSVLL